VRFHRFTQVMFFCHCSVTKVTIHYHEEHLSFVVTNITIPYQIWSITWLLLFIDKAFRFPPKN
jgi:hypothetical protein